MNTRSILFRNYLHGAALVCAWSLVGMAAARGQTVEELNQSAAAKMAAYDWKGAIADFDRSIALDPKQPRVLNNRGYAKMEVLDMGGALDDFNNAIALDPKFAGAYSNRAVAEEGKEDPKAAADFQHAIALYPQSTEPYLKRGRIELNKGDDGPAMEDFEQAIRLDPNAASAWYERARVKEDKGDMEGAVSDESRAIALDPKNAGYYDGRASDETGMGDLQACFADHNRAVDLDPRTSGDINRRAGKHVPARKLAPAPADQSAALRITLDIHPQPGEDADLRKIHDATGKLDYTDPDAHFCLIVENISSKPVLLEPVKIHVPYFEITDENGAAFSVCRPPLGADSAVRGGIIYSLAPHEKTVIQIPYVVPDVRKNWGPDPNYPFPYPAPGKSKQVTIRAVLQFKPGPDPGDENSSYWSGLVTSGYWTGRVVSEPYKVILVGSKQKEKP